MLFPSVPSLLEASQYTKQNSFPEHFVQVLHFGKLFELYLIGLSNFGNVSYFYLILKIGKLRLRETQ
jgi:hypothetical protein